MVSVNYHEWITVTPILIQMFMFHYSLFGIGLSGAQYIIPLSQDHDPRSTTVPCVRTLFRMIAIRSGGRFLSKSVKNVWNFNF